MGTIKIVLIICGPLFGLITFFLLKNYNSGYGTLALKRWVIRTAFFTLLLFITSIILYFIIPEQQDKILNNKMMVKINDIEKSIGILNEYIDNQKEIIKESNLNLEQLKTEHKQLEQIVHAERETVESLLKVYDYRQRKSKWLDYGVLFIMGIITTLICNGLMSLWQKEK